MEKKIRFQGQEFFLIGGAIATKEQYENGKCSYAHLMPNGEILRFGVQIGSRKDIEFLGEEELNPRLVNIITAIADPEEWKKNEIAKG